MAQTIMLAAQIYLGIGILFALLYLVFAVGRVSPNARGSSPLFRLLVLPGTVVLWPLVIRIWRSRRNQEKDKR